MDLRGYDFFSLIRLAKDLFLTRLFFPKARLVRFPIRVRGRKSVNFGFGLTTGLFCRIDSFSKHKHQVINFGNNVQINDFVHIAACESIMIGDNTLIASRVFITDHNHGSYGSMSSCSTVLCPPIERPLVSSPVYIGRDVWIGESVCILPGVTIGDGAVIGAGSVVNKSIGPYRMAVGVPAKAIKMYSFDQGCWVKCTG